MTEDASPSPIRVLLVDDSRLTRLSLRTTIQEDATRFLLVGEAEEGRQALELTEKLRPDVILMDIGMPVMDGISATQAIRKRFPAVKIIMLTSHESEQDVLDAFQSGANSYCLKETPPELIRHVIASTHADACWIDPKIARIVVSRMQPAIGVPSAHKRDDDGPTTFTLLTEREVEVLKLVADGQNNTDISESLCISANTVKTHLKNIFAKLEVEDRTAAALKALKERII